MRKCFILCCFVISICTLGTTQEWEVVGGGVPGIEAFDPSGVCLASFQDKLYVAGNDFLFDMPNYGVAAWDGTSWQSPGFHIPSLSVFGQSILTLNVINNELYIGGNYTTIDGNTSSPSLIRFNGTSWEEVTVSFLITFSIRDLEPYSGTLYAAGEEPALFENSIMFLNSTFWDDLPGINYDNTIFDLQEYNGLLYWAANQGVYGYDGQNATLINGSPDWAQTLTIYDGKLIVGTKNDFIDNGIYSYDGNSWTQVGGNTANGINDIEEYNGKLYICGKNGDQSYSAYLKGQNWEILPSLNGQGHDLEVHQGELYMTGEFDGSVAKLSGTTSVTDGGKEIIEIFPNPVSDFITINYPKGNSYFLQIINSVGEIVLAQSLNDNQLDIRHLPTGIYFLSLYSDDKTYQKRIIKH